MKSETFSRDFEKLLQNKTDRSIDNLFQKSYNLFGKRRSIHGLFPSFLRRVLQASRSHTSQEKLLSDRAGAVSFCAVINSVGMKYPLTPKQVMGGAYEK